MCPEDNDLCFYTCVGPVGVVSHPCLTVQRPAGAQGVYSISCNPFKEFPCCFTSRRRVSNPHRGPMGLTKCILAFWARTVYVTWYADRRFMDFFKLFDFSPRTGWKTDTSLMSVHEIQLQPAHLAWQLDKPGSRYVLVAKHTVAQPISIKWS